MFTFLSPEWIDALDTAGRRGDPGGEEIRDDVTIVIEQRVTNPDDDDIVYSISVSPDGVRVRPGPTDSPGVTFAMTRPTAVAIAEGALSAQAAFMAGDLQIGGDTSALLRSPDAFLALGDRFEAVRDNTEW